MQINSPGHPSSLPAMTWAPSGKSIRYLNRSTVRFPSADSQRGNNMTPADMEPRPHSDGQ